MASGCVKLRVAPLKGGLPDWAAAEDRRLSGVLWAPDESQLDETSGYTVQSAVLYRRAGRLDVDPARCRVVAPDGALWTVVAPAAVWADSGGLAGSTLQLRRRTIIDNCLVTVEVADSGELDSLGSLVRAWAAVWRGPAAVARHDVIPARHDGEAGAIESARVRGWLPWRGLPEPGLSCRLRVADHLDPALDGVLSSIDWRGWDDDTGRRRLEAERVAPDDR
jgi:hypothetical protein